MQTLRVDRLRIIHRGGGLRHVPKSLTVRNTVIPVREQLQDGSSEIQQHAGSFGSFFPARFPDLFPVLALVTSSIMSKL